MWTASQSERRLLVTQDLDFSDIRKYAPGTHHGLVVVRLSDPSRANLVQRIGQAFAAEAVESYARMARDFGALSPAAQADIE